MKNFIKYHPRQSSTILRIFSGILIILIFCLGLWNYDACNQYRSQIHHRYHIHWARVNDSVGYNRTPILYGTAKQKQNQLIGVNDYKDVQYRQSGIGIFTIIGILCIWSFTSFLIGNYLRPLIPFELYVEIIKHKVKRFLKI